ncbi:UvrD-helicase domain-containing protein [Desulfoluna spongiiphila]|uniref:DNA 3'-5' helicase n=1 Tax=Desulfoluna spongiiphila TaxID=419481 RepID=A0A1G5IDP3_9BACT|nr:UvrD-helicase domain-containing protein [Desulfoluna spongiiphila]SCY74077.1 TIGR00375 family protein [Desulfoluna spongiiphila]
MPFIADLHIHSKYSRATSRDLDLETLYRHARLKGIDLLGTGDFTHPAWMAEIEEKLVPTDSGLFTLRPDLIEASAQGLPGTISGGLHYMLSSEISCIYKKDGATRKNHNLVFFPSIDSAKAFNKKLSAIGNITSDGRPILGLDARDLLEIVLETDANGVLIPAHIWTPWFSMLGSKSGFDSVSACFGDLSDHIFAGETGLSSDPPMNRRVSMLDGITLISNSDAHSPAKLAREANIFTTERAYDAIFHALKAEGNPGFEGTLEFFPEEGKYHMDGHRKCGVSLEPNESLALGDLCPVCGKPLTLGVLHRVLALADRSEEAASAVAPRHPGFESLIPLEEILSEIFSVGPKSKKVQTQLAGLVTKLGPELAILRDRSREELSSAGIPLLGEAITRVRQREVVLEGGYDGEYGVVKVFSEDDKAELPGQTLLFQVPKAPPADRISEPKAEDKPIPPAVKKNEKKNESPATPAKGLNALQEEAVHHPPSPLLIVAGPGTGKTHTITRRIARLVETGIDPDAILAITFTNRAAREMAERLEGLVGQRIPLACTFHALALDLLSHREKDPIAIADDAARKRLLKETLLVSLSAEERKAMRPGHLSRLIERARQLLIAPDDDLSRVTEIHADLFRRCYSAYEQLLKRNGLLDFEGLIFRLVRALESDPAFQEELTTRFAHIFIDEYQDLNHAQYRLTQLLAPAGHAICVIGDPDQAIYGFRGSSAHYFHRFVSDQPEATRITLTRNYRSSKTILAASGSVLGDKEKVVSDIDGAKHITILPCRSGEEEAVAIGKQVEQLIGGIGFHSMDFGGAVDNAVDLSFGDMAVLTRTHAHGVEIASRLSAAGIPCAVTAKSGPFDHPVMHRFVATLKLATGCGSLMDLEAGLPLLSGKTVTFPLYPPVSNDGQQLGIADLIANPYLLSDTWCSDRETMLAVLGAILKLRMACGTDAPATQIHCLLEKLSDVTRSMQEDETLADAMQSFLGQAEAFGTRGTTAKFLAQAALATEQDTLAMKAEKVSILTLHASKGLEFPVVFIAGCEAGNLPFEPAYGDPADLDEERRLFYVAMTRAKERLFLTHAAKRLRFGEPVECAPSPYLSDIEEHLKQSKKRSIAPAKAQGPVQMSLF